MLANPAAVDLFGGNLADLARQAFVDALAGPDVGLAEAVRRKLEVLRADLLGLDPTPVERLPVGRVAACWLQVPDAEVRYAQVQGKLTIPQADYHQRRMDAAHRQYLSALKTLAVVRKLAVPALQVNIARKQVNVVGTP
jgi:hypothetical protein